jgi:hypothetical protein
MHAGCDHCGDRFAEGVDFEEVGCAIEVVKFLGG